MAELEIKLPLDKAKRFKRHIERTHPSIRGRIKLENHIPIRRSLRRLRGRVNTLVNRNSFKGPRFDKQAATFTKLPKKPTD